MTDNGSYQAIPIPTSTAIHALVTGPLDAENAETARIALDALAPNTRRAYRIALDAITDWHGGEEPTDKTMARFLIDRFESGAAPSSLKQAVAAVRWLARKTGRPSPTGERVRDTLKRLSEVGAGRGRGQASPLTYDEAVRIVTLAKKPIDRAIVACLFMAGLRRSEAAALEWRDIEDAPDASLRVRVRTSKTNREGGSTDIRFVKGTFADALRVHRPEGAAPSAKVFGGRDPQTIGRRFQRAASRAGIDRKLTAYSGRVGLASELTARGATETEVMLAGAWKTSRMVAHYSAGARAERGAVAKYL